MPPDPIGSVVVEDTEGSTPDMKILRANLYSAEHVEQWVKKYSDESCTSWIVSAVQSVCIRMVYHKVWDCHLSHRNKTKKRPEPSCPARLDIKVKVVTPGSQRNDRFLRRDPPLSAIIKLMHQHNHPVGCPEAPRSSRPTAEARARFLGYFESGMTPSQAIHHNEALLAAEAALNRGSNPRHSAVYAWHREWRKAKYGLRENPLPKLQERAASFAASGVNVHTCGTGDSWAVLVVTPIMRRAQQLKSASELVFVDSVSSCDETKSTVTCLLAATRAGAVPIATLIHNEQSEEGYQMAFELLKSTHPLCFGGREFPTAFVTSPSPVEKPALSHVWPLARQLLCHVRTLQSEWRWLTDAQNGVPKSKRRPCLSAFHKILKARGEEELAAATEVFECGMHDAYVDRMNTFLGSEEEWSLGCRVGVTTLDQAALDYSEASVRVLKDILLSQMVAWNAVVLTDFIIVELETYLEARLLRHIDPREAMQETTYEKLLRGGEVCGAPCRGGNVVHLESERAYSFRNRYGRTECEVHPELSFCTCWSGSQGGFCRHQITVLRDFGGDHFPRAPEVTLRDCQLLAKLALGEKSLPPSFFPMSSETQGPSGKDFVGNPADGIQDDCGSEFHEDHSYFRGNSDTEMSEAQEAPNRSIQGGNRVLEARERKFRAFVSRLRKAHELAKDCPGYLTLLDRIIADLRGVGTSTAAYNLFLRVGASSFLEKRHRAAPTIKRPRRVLRTNQNNPDGTWGVVAVSGSVDSNSGLSDASDASNAAASNDAPPLTDAEIVIGLPDADDASNAVFPGVSLSDAANSASDAASHVMDTDVWLSDANRASDAASHLTGANPPASSAASRMSDANICLSGASNGSLAVPRIMDTKFLVPVELILPKVVWNNGTNVCLPVSNLTNTNNVCLMSANDASSAASRLTSAAVCLPAGNAPSKVASNVTNTSVCLVGANDASSAVPRLTGTAVCVPDVNNTFKVEPNLTTVGLLGANNSSGAASHLTSTGICLPAATDAPKTVSYLTDKNACPSGGKGASRDPPRITVIEMHIPNPVTQVQYVASLPGAAPR